MYFPFIHFHKIYYVAFRCNTYNPKNEPLSNSAKTRFSSIRIWWTVSKFKANKPIVFLIRYVLKLRVLTFESRFLRSLTNLCFFGFLVCPSLSMGVLVSDMSYWKISEFRVLRILNTSKCLCVFDTTCKHNYDDSLSFTFYWSTKLNVCLFAMLIWTNASFWSGTRRGYIIEKLR